MNGQADGDGVLTSLGIGSGEPATPEADKYLEAAVKELDGGSAENPGSQPPEGGDKPPETVNKPEEQKPPSDEAGKPVETAEDFDKIENPTPENWKKAREALKAERQRIKDMEAAAHKGPEGGTPETRQVETPAPQAPKAADIQPDFIFETLVKVVSGEETKFKRADMERYIQNKLTPAQVKGVIDAAKEGRFGEASEEVAALAREQLPLVIASADENRTREAEFGKLRSEREAAAKELMTAYPEIGGKDVENPVYKEVNAACLELEATIPNFQSIPNAPRILKQFVDMRRASARAEALTVERDALKAENERLTKLVGKPVKPPAGGGGDKPQVQSADDWLKEQVADGKLRID